jgi:hypothetical protein
MGVYSEYIENIRSSLDTFAYYLVVAGYDLPDGQVVLLPL